MQTGLKPGADEAARRERGFAWTDNMPAPEGAGPEPEHAGIAGDTEEAGAARVAAEERPERGLPKAA